MIHYIKYIIKSRKLNKVVKRINKAAGDNVELRCLNYQMDDIEASCYDIYNEALRCPFISNKKKRDILEDVKKFTGIMNSYRLENGFVY